MTTTGPEGLHFAPFHLDAANQTFWRNSEPLGLRSKPFALLRYLAENPRRLVTREELLKAVWANAAVSDGLLRGYIRELRRVLGDDAERPRYIETVPGRGYRFVASVTHSAKDRTVRALALSAPSRGPRDGSGAPRLVGRDAESARLDACLALALAGERQIVFVAGELGAGKTTLLGRFLARASNEPMVLVARGQCVERFGEREAYLPVLDALGRLCKTPAATSLVDTLERHAPTWLVQMPATVSEARFDVLQRRLQGATQGRMLREIAEALEIVSREHPLVVALEDLHWSDHFTVELIALLARRREPARLMVVGTYRTVDLASGNHPLKLVVEGLKAHRECKEVLLGALDEVDVSQYLGSRFPSNQFPAGLAQAIHQNTEGNPLFMVAVIDDLVNRRVAIETQGLWTLHSSAAEVASRTPQTLFGLIDDMIDRLTESEQRVLEASSVAGAEFSTAAVAAALSIDVHDVEVVCEALTRRRHCLRRAGSEVSPDGTLHDRYAVVHSMYRQVAFDRAPPARRRLWHSRIVAHTGEGFGDQATEVTAEFAECPESGRGGPARSVARPRA